jgi:hypothetical protein
LGSRLLLTTVHQATPWTPTGGDLTPIAIRHGRTLLERAARDLDQTAEMRALIGEPAERLRYSYRNTSNASNEDAALTSLTFTTVSLEQGGCDSFA